MSILKMLGFGGAEPKEPLSAETETVRKIVQRLDGMEAEQARFVAAFAYILSRVAHADRDISTEETAAMERIVLEQGELPEDQAIIVVQMAKTQSLFFGGTENFLVTREFNKIAGRREKLALLDCLFAVSAADDTVSGVEDGEIRKIATELLLDHADFIAVRKRYRDQLGVFQTPPDE